MKRFFPLLLGLFVLAGIIYLLTTEWQEVDLLTLVPRQCGAVITWDHPARAYQRFARTKSWKNIGTMDQERTLAALGLANSDIATISTCGKLWHVLKGKRFIGDVFRRNIVFALVPARESAQSPSSPVMQPLFLAAVTEGHTAVKLHSLLKSLKIVTPLPTLRYQGYTIYGVTIQNIGPLYISCAQGVFLVAVDPAPIRQSLDLLMTGLKGGSGTIRENLDFMRFRRQVKGTADFFCYLDPELLAAKIVHQASGHEKIIQTLHTVLQRFAANGLRRLAWYHRREKKVHQVRLLLHFDQKSLPPLLKRLAGRPPAVDRELARTTANLQLYLRSNWLDLPAWWRTRGHERVDRELKRAGRVDRTIRRYTGMDMERFLALFGHRFTVVVKEFKTSGFFPIPRLCLRIALADKIVVRELLEKFVGQLPHRRERIGGVDVVSILAAGGLMQPTLGLSDHDLFFIDGHDLVADLLTPSALLIKDPDFIRVAFDNEKPANLLCFSRMAPMARSLKEAARWLGAFIAVRDGIGGERGKMLLDYLALPFFDDLTMFKAGFVIGRTKSEELDLTARLLVRTE